MTREYFCVDTSPSFFMDFTVIKVLRKQWTKLNINICVALWRWVPGMSRGFHFNLAKPAYRLSYAPMAGKPAPFQSWATTPVEPDTCHNDLSLEKKEGGEDGAKRMIQRLNEERGCQETL